MTDEQRPVKLSFAPFLLPAEPFASSAGGRGNRKKTRSKGQTKWERGWVAQPAHVSVSASLPSEAEARELEVRSHVLRPRCPPHPTAYTTVVLVAGPVAAALLSWLTRPPRQAVSRVGRDRRRRWLNDKLLRDMAGSLTAPEMETLFRPPPFGEPTSAAPMRPLVAVQLPGARWMGCTCGSSHVRLRLSVSDVNGRADAAFCLFSRLLCLLTLACRSSQAVVVPRIGSSPVVDCAEVAHIWDLFRNIDSDKQQRVLRKWEEHLAEQRADRRQQQPASPALRALQVRLVTSQ